MRFLSASLLSGLLCAACASPPPIDLGGEGEGEGEAVGEGEGEAVGEGEGEGPVDGEGNCSDLADGDGDDLFDCDDVAGCGDDPACARGDTALGGPCDSNDDCDTDRPLCLSERGVGYPGGTCSTWCLINEESLEQDCPAGFVCADFANLAGSRGYCTERCDDEAGGDDCRDGYACSAYDPFQICFPACDDDADCAATGACYDGIGFLDGRCVAPEDCVAEEDEDQDGRINCEDDECRARPECSLDALCAAPPALPLGVDVEGDNSDGSALTGSVSDLNCRTGNFLGREDVYSVTAGVAGRSGTLTVQITGLPDFGLYLRAACDDVDSEVGCVDNGSIEEGETLIVGVEGGVPYTLFVEGNSAVHAGAYTLRASFVEDVCGDDQITGREGCDDGNDEGSDGCSAQCQPEIDFLCSDAAPLPEGGVDGTTVDSNSNFFQGSCTFPENTANEQLWTFTPTTSGTALLRLANVEDDKDLMFYVRTDCDDPATEVACADDRRGGGDESREFPVVAGQRYTVIVDGSISSPFDDSSYALRLTLP